MCFTWRSNNETAWCAEGAEFDSGYNLFFFLLFFSFFFFSFTFSLYFSFCSFLLFLYMAYVFF